MDFVPHHSHYVSLTFNSNVAALRLAYEYLMDCGGGRQTNTINFELVCALVDVFVCICTRRKKNIYSAKHISVLCFSLMPFFFHVQNGGLRA